MPKLRTVPASAVTTSEMANILGCSRSTLYRNYQKGLYRRGVHYGLLSPNCNKSRIRWNVEAVLKLHGLAG